MKLNLIVVICFLFAVSLNIKPYQRHLLLDQWKLTVIHCPPPGNNLKNKQFNVTLPTVFHLDLLYHKQIEDPFFQNTFQTLRWISDCDIKYSKSFQLSQTATLFQSIVIGFQGIDTYSSIKLNDKQILVTNNSFIEYRANIKDFLNSGINTIEVFIESTKKYDDQGQRVNRMPFQYAQTRKACYQYSWDWAPYLNTMGIWKNVYIQYFQKIKIDYVWIRNKQISQQSAILNFAIKFDISKSFEFKETSYKVVIEYQNNSLFSGPLQNEEQYHQIIIKNPKLWWANGLGEPFIYDFIVKIISGQNTLDKKLVSYGIRTVKLDQTNNKFDIYLNGHKVYCKGANYVPPDMLYPRLTNSLYTAGNTIQNLLNDAVSSNFNMIRLWGGGQYESNQFYEMASRKGIMIFYDFMFSDSIYPSTQAFLKNVEIQFVQQIRRVRNYPCLTLWSGNNQILQGILSWGWGKANYKQDYHKLFQILIPKIIKNQSPYIPYIPSSPVNGIGNGGFQRGGDVHYWGVWAAGANFEAYQTAIGPFNSQFGTQSLPLWETIIQFTKPQNRKYEARQFQSHERHGSRFNTLRRYMTTYSNKSLNFQLQTYQSGLVQAYAIQIAIKAQRSSGISSGTLYWQFNDAWPAISWSSIDYFGRWKPLQYMAKRLYEDIVAFYRPSTNKVFAINNKLYEIECYVVVKVMSFEGQIYSMTNFTLTLRQNEIKQVTKISNDQLQKNSQKVVILTSIYYGNNQNQNVKISNFLKPFKNLQLPQCQLSVTYKLESDQILLAAPCLIKNLHIYHSSTYLYLNDNYFDVIPEEVYRIKLLKGQKLSNLYQKIKFRGYKESVKGGDQQTKIEVV